MPQSFNLFSRDLRLNEGAPTAAAGKTGLGVCTQADPKPGRGRFISPADRMPDFDTRSNWALLLLVQQNPLKQQGRESTPL
jgi:hypothetical protein